MLTDVGGIRVGHCSDIEHRTGCTVVLFDRRTVAGVDVAGANPSTKDTDLLRPMSNMPEVHAIVLTGGSSFGIEAAFGVSRYLEQHGRGFNVGVALVPIVPTAVIFDLAAGSASVRPDIPMGLKACENASVDGFVRGQVGAGTGATVGKFLGMGRCSPGGIGTASVALPGGVRVGAMVVVNAFGDVYDRRLDRVVAGVRDENGDLLDTYELMKRGMKGVSAFAFMNTTIGVVSTNAPLTKEEANRVAVMAQDGIARSISPAHLSVDGDTLFATGECDSTLAYSLDLVGSAAAEVVEAAILDAVSPNRGGGGGAKPGCDTWSLPDRPGCRTPIRSPNRSVLGVTASRSW